MKTMSAMPKISVVIPLYNKREHILETVQTVLRQTYAAMEVLIIDDGSTDGGAQLLESCDYDSVCVIRQENGGVSLARNRGIREARGELVAFLDADDSWEPHFLELIVGMTRDFPEAAAFTTAYQFKQGGEFLDPKIRFTRKFHSAVILDDYFVVGSRGDLPFMMSSICVRKDVCEALQGFPENEPMGEDQDFFARLAIQYSIAYSPRVSAFYHLDTDNRACDAYVPAEECPFSLRLKHTAMLTSDSNLREQLLDYTGAHLLHLASRQIRKGAFRQAQELLADRRCKRHTLRFIRWQFAAFVQLFRAAKLWS